MEVSEGNKSKYPLNCLVQAWWEKIRLAKKFKKVHFQDDADLAMKFFVCGKELNEYIWETKLRDAVEQGSEQELPSPQFRMLVGKVAELVQLFGPALYHRNPTIVVESKTLDLPLDLLMALVPPEMLQQAQQAAQMQGQQFTPQSLFPPDPEENQNRLVALLLQYYLDYMQRENDKKTHSRRCIDEALIKGMGCLAGGTELYVKYRDHVTVTRIRDLYRAWKNGASLWDGEKWVRVTEMIRYPRTGKEIALVLRSGERISCTRDHKWPTTNGVKLADQLEIGDCLASTQLPEPPNSKSPLHLPDDDIGWFIGLYLAEGHVSKDKKDCHVGIASHIEETATHERLTKIVGDYGGEIRWRGKDGTKKWDATIYSRVLAAVIREYVTPGGAYKKYLRAACWDRSDAFLSSLMLGYLSGDGSLVEDENIWRLHFCENDGLARSIRTLCARLGHKLTLNKLTSKNGITDNYTSFKGSIRLDGRPRLDGKWASLRKDKCEIVAIEDADWRCDYYYDLNVECEPRLFALATGTLSHNCLWTEKYEPYEGSTPLIGSFYDTVDNLVIDPDSDTIDEGEWVARRRIWPVWKVADHFDIDYDYLFKKYGGTHESVNSQAETVSNRKTDEERKLGRTNDLMEFWEVYSKMGMGHKLAGVDKKVEGLYDLLDEFGPYCHLCIAKDVPYPLNLKQTSFKKALAEKDHEKADKLREDAFLSVQWPIPFWSDGSWPFTPLIFHEVPNNPWPMSHIKPGLCYLEFITWCMSFLVNHVRTSCATVVSCMKALDEEFKSTLLSGRDFRLLEVEGSLIPDGDVKKAVHFLEMPTVNKDLWEILEACSSLFEKATGLNDLLYAATGGFRSAQEVNVKSTNANVRPDDMANKTEDMLSLVARKEAMAARWLLDAESVAPVLGQRGTMYWEQYVMSSEIEVVAREFHYRVEAGSTRKPNKETRVAQINQALQQWQPLIQWSLASLGTNPDAPKILNSMIGMWCEANDVEKKGLQFTPPPPPPPNPEMQKVQAEMQMMQQEGQMKERESQMKLQFEQQKLELDKQKMAMDLQAQQMKTQADMQKAAADIQIAQTKAHTEMQLAQQKGQQEMQLGAMQAQGDMQVKQQEIGAKREEMQMNTAQKQQEMKLGAVQKQQELQMGAQQHAQELEQSSQQHKTQMTHEKQAGQQKLKLTAEQSKAKIQQTKAQAKAKPKSKGKK